jgi:ATP-dependent RNA helicase SUPV3L1/SUV3
VVGEEVLKPRLRLIADEQLTGAPREIAQARLDLWLKTHVEKLLGPLFQLSASEEITGIARGVAFQLVEGLGVLDRRKVSEEVKGLDQPARATLRKFGVRFGAYNIYIPPLLKPAPRVLALQLWALKQAGRSTAGLDTVERLASSGRTSIAVDREIESALYAVAGYRVCGERAVRVDMLERLADIIRPALAWREGAPGIKPAAAFDGSGCFTVVVGMTSLVGCAGEDFAAILRSLGYRMEQRPKPAEPAVPEAAISEALPEPAAAPVPAGTEAESPVESVAEAAPLFGPEAASEPAAAFATEAVPESVGSAELLGGPVPDLISDPAPALPPEGEPAPAEPPADPRPPMVSAGSEMPAPAPVPVPEPVSETVSETAQADQADQADQAEPAATASDIPAAAPAARIDGAAVPSLFVEVWRLGRPDGPRRRRRPPRAGQEAHPRSERPDRAIAPLAAADGAALAASGDAAGGPASAAEAGEGAQQRQDRRPRRHRQGRPDQNRSEQDRPDQSRPDQRRADHQRPDRAERPERQGRPERPGRNDRDRPDRDPELRAKYVKSRGESRDRRDKAPDPNSPFAKLAALKEQLEANAKERR